LLALAGCAEPRFGAPDTLDSSSPGNGLDAQEAACEAAQCPAAPDLGWDAGGLLDASYDAVVMTGDPVRDSWIGRYAVRSAMYSVDGILHGSAELLSLVEIKAGATGLVLEEQLCKFEGGWNTLGIEGYLRFEFPPSKSSATMSYTDKDFASATNTFAFGYGELPEACVGASTLAVPPAPWRTSDCICAQEIGPPSDLRDCRITDPEPDTHPGITLNGLVNGSVWSYYGVQQQRIRYLNGYRRGQNLYASQEGRDTTHIFDCAGPPTGCIIGAAVPCPPKYNESQFVPILGDYDCKRVVLEEAGLFPTPIPAFPAACPNDLQ